jgi:guanine deaminase
VPADPQQFMLEALRLAEANVIGGEGGPFGAVIVRAGQVIARGTNRVALRHDPTAHAEVVAIREACRVLGTFQLSGCEIYASCEPCPMCLGAIYWARLDRLYFAGTRADAARAGFDDSRIYDEIPRPLAARTLPTVQLAHPDAGRPFAAWAAQGDRVDY